MELYRISIPKDDVWRVVEQIGLSNFAHFIDLNKEEKAFQLPYAFRIKMCDDTERRIAFLLQKSIELKVACTRPKNIETQTLYADIMAKNRQIASELLFDSIEKDIQQKEQFVLSQSRMITEMQNAINKKVDLCWVLTFVAKQSNALNGHAMQSAFQDG
jgi:hypothetical protein